MIFNASDVEEIANESGEKKKTVRSGPGQKKKSRQNNNRYRDAGKKMARGAWSKKQRKQSNNVVVMIIKDMNYRRSKH